MSRRGGILAALGALVTGLDGGTADAARKATRRHEKLACRNTHSECTVNEQCCSNRCVPKFGGTSFRCATPHGRKKNDGKGGKGGGGQSPVPTGDRCTPGVSVCADPLAQCINRACGGDNAFYCLRPVGAACTDDAECSIDVCTAGICASSCTVGPLGSGATYETIADAVDNTASGDVITIMPGSYFAEITLQDTYRNFRRCCGAGQVVWKTEDGGTTTVTIHARYANAGATFEHIDFLGTEPGEPRESMIYIQGGTSDEWVATAAFHACTFSEYTGADSYPVLGMFDRTNVTIEGCSFIGNDSVDAGGAIISEGYSASVRNVLVITDTLFEDNRADAVPPDPPEDDGGAIYMEFTNATITDCSFISNAGYNGGALAIKTGCNVILTDTEISGNSAEEYGGGIWVRAYDSNSGPEEKIILTLAGDTTVTGNTTTLDGSGLTVTATGAPANLEIIGASTRISGNTGGDQCIISSDDGGTYVSFNCDYP